MEKHSDAGRREFLKASVFAGVVPYFAWSQPSFENRSKNDRPTIGCIGLGGIGQHDGHQHSRFGRIFVNRQRITGAPIEDKIDEKSYSGDDRRILFKGKQPEGHKHNFFRCIREGGLPVSDVFSHTQILQTCHLAGIAARLGTVIHWDPQEEKIIGNDLATSFVWSIADLYGSRSSPPQ